MQGSQDQTPKQKFLNNLSNLLQRYKMYLIVVLIVIVAGVVTFTIVSEVRKNRISTSTQKIEQLQDNYEQWLTKEDEGEKAELEEAILTDADAIIENYPTLYAAQRAYFVKATFFFEQQEYSKAVTNFIELVSKFPDSYLAPISLVNAAVAFEENGEIQKAIEQYEKLVNSYKETFPGTPEALFSLGRLYEKAEEFTSAFEAYSDIEDTFPSSNWTKLARNRIIKLKVDGKI